MSFKGQTAWITGASSGIGAALAKALAEQGARLVLSGRKVEALEAVAADCGGDCLILPFETTDIPALAPAVEQAWAWASSASGGIDLLVNNAGISGRARMDDPQAEEVWDRLIQVNLQGLFNVTHAFVPALKQSRGCIVNLSSIVAFVSGISSAGYIASKGAVRSFTQALARDLAPYGVRANAVAPGLMLTEMVAPQLAVPGGTDWYMKRVPMARGGQPEEVVGPIVFLASAMASYVNGVVLPVDGGFLSA